MTYVDGFVLCVPEKNLPAYKKMAKRAAKLWVEHGALQYIEAVGDDMNTKFGVPFPRVINSKRGEVIVFAWVLYKSRAHRDRVNAKVMSDPRLLDQAEQKNMPFDCSRMLYGGFKTLVQAQP